MALISKLTLEVGGAAKQIRPGVPRPGVPRSPDRGFPGQGSTDQGSPDQGFITLNIRLPTGLAAISDLVDESKIKMLGRFLITCKTIQSKAIIYRAYFLI